METQISSNVATDLLNDANPANNQNQSNFPHISSHFPAFGFVRLWQIIGCKKRGIPPVIPVSSTAWQDGVKAGIYPKPIKISKRTSVWRAEDIVSLYNKFSAGDISL